MGRRGRSLSNYSNNFVVRSSYIRIEESHDERNDERNDPIDYQHSNEPGSYLYSYLSNTKFTYRENKEKEEIFWADNRLQLRKELGKTISKITTNQGISTSRIYLIDVFDTSYCSSSHGSQFLLISKGYFPTSKPNIAFSLKMLLMYRNLLLTSFVSIDGFIQTVQNMQPGAKFPSDIKTLFQSSFLEYRNMMQTFEYNYSGCIACPKGGEPGDIHIAADGNFRLFRRKLAGKYNFRRSKESEYFEDIKAHEVQSEADDSGCSTVFRCPGIKKNSTSDQTGIFGLFCARHEIPLKFCDMFTGERYFYPKKLLPHVLQLGRKNYLYYDIACKIIPHLKKIPAYQGYELIGAVPKLHANVHQWSCFRKYHPLRVIGSAETDGETSERAWSYLGRFSLISREMLSGNRKDLLVDAWRYYKTKKQRTIMKTLTTSLRKKTEELSRRTSEFNRSGVNYEYAETLYTSEITNQLPAELPDLGLRFHPDQLKFFYDLKCDVNDLRHMSQVQNSNRYDKGHKVLKKVWRRKSNLVKKINKKILSYNETISAFTEYDKVISNEVYNIDSKMWSGLKDNVFDTIDMFCRMERAKEEVALLKIEIERTKNHIQTEIDLIEQRLATGDPDDEIPAAVLTNWLFHLRKTIEVDSHIQSIIFNRTESLVGQNDRSFPDSYRIDENGIGVTDRFDENGMLLTYDDLDEFESMGMPDDYDVDEEMDDDESLINYDLEEEACEDATI